STRGVAATALRLLGRADHVSESSSPGLPSSATLGNATAPIFGNRNAVAAQFTNISSHRVSKGRRRAQPELWPQPRCGCWDARTTFPRVAADGNPGLEDATASRLLQPLRGCQAARFGCPLFVVALLSGPDLTWNRPQLIPFCFFYSAGRLHLASTMELRLLRTFKAVAEAGSFTQAASRIHLTQAAVSVHIRQLAE